VCNPIAKKGLLMFGYAARQRRGHPLDHIPGDDGWPVVGNTLTVLRDPIRAVDAMYRKYGPVYRSRVFG